MRTTQKVKITTLKWSYKENGRNNTRKQKLKQKKTTEANPSKTRKRNNR
jgi:hypothetical protein